MADSPNLKDVARNKIKELEQEARLLQGELSSEVSFNMAAWNEYGSELCAGEMIRKESEIRARIARVESKISLLCRFIGDKIDLYRHARLKKGSADIVAQIASLKDSKELIDFEVAEIDTIKDLLGID